MNSIAWTLSWLLMLLGAGLVIAGKVTSSYRKKKQPYKGRAVGTVVDIVADEPDETGKAAGIHDYYYPIIAYYAKGRLIKAKYIQGSNPCEFRINQEIQLYYDEENPETFKIAEPNPLKRISMVCYFSGYGMCILGGILFMMFAFRFFSRF